MSYGEIYRIYVPSIRHNTYVVEIEQKDYTGSSTALKGGGEPFVTTLDDDDFVYLPLRLSTAKLSLVGDDALASLFATTYQEYRVTLLRNGVPLWCGFIKPELYTQDYSTPTHEISIDCLSAISALEFVKYTQLDSAGLQFVSLKSLISRAVLAANGRYGKVYIPHTFVNTSTDSTNALMRDDCVISEQNFFDEEDKPMSYKDILEEICRFSHTTLYDDYGNLYFVDHDYTGRYDEWTLVGGSLSLTTADALFVGTQSVQDIGFGGSGHSLDVIAGYNKATVKTNNYNNADKVFPEEDWDKLKALAIEMTQMNLVSAVSGVIKTTKTDTVARGRCMWLEPKKWSLKMYTGTGKTPLGEDISSFYNPSNGFYFDNGQIITEEITEITDINSLLYAWTGSKEYTGQNYPTQDFFETRFGFNSHVYGAFLGKYCEWKLNENKTDSITSYNYEDVIFIRKSKSDVAFVRSADLINQSRLTCNFKNHSGIMTYAGKMPVAAYADGAIAINMQVAFLSYAYNSGLISAKTFSDDGFYYSSEYNDNYIIASAGFHLTFKLRIGDKYWDGAGWTTVESTFEVKLKFDSVNASAGFASLDTNKTLAMPYNGLEGWIIELAGTMRGELYFEIANVTDNCVIKDLSLKYQIKDDYSKDTSDDDDRVYSNVVNADYVNELDEIEEKISSYNHDGLCYSKVLLGNDYITDNLYETINNTTTRPEELLLRRLVNQYEHPKIKLTQVLMNSNEILRPIDKLTDTYQLAGKKFVITGKETSYRSDTSEIKMIEKA